MEVPQVAPKCWARDRGRAVDVAGPQKHLVVLCLPPGVCREPAFRPVPGWDTHSPQVSQGLPVVLWRVRTLGVVRL